MSFQLTETNKEVLWGLLVGTPIETIIPLPLSFKQVVMQL